MIDQWLAKDDVVDAIAHDKSVDEAFRTRALELAQKTVEDARRLNNRSWAAVRVPKATVSMVAKSLKYAELANRLDPDNGNYRNTLGVAQYRSGKYSEALATLLQSEEMKLRLPDDIGDHNQNSAFIAMALFKLGRQVEAQQRLHQMRVLTRDLWKYDFDAQALLREAEELIEKPNSSPALAK